MIWCKAFVIMLLVHGLCCIGECWLFSLMHRKEYNGDYTYLIDASNFGDVWRRLCGVIFIYFVILLTMYISKY